MVTAVPRRRFPCCQLLLSQSQERYLKAIYQLHFRTPPVSTTRLAEWLDVAAASVSAMLRRLETDGLLSTAGASGDITLSEHGQRHACYVIRRHRLIETFLVRAVGMAWDEVHVEAQALEHAASDRLIERIDAALGHPRSDPHGDPIPESSGDHREEWPPALADAPVDATFRVDRVSDEDSAALRYLAERGVRPGVTLRVAEREPFDGPIWIEVAGDRHPLGVPVAAMVHGTVGP